MIHLTTALDTLNNDQPKAKLCGSAIDEHCDENQNLSNEVKIKNQQLRNDPFSGNLHLDDPKVNQSNNDAHLVLPIRLARLSALFNGLASNDNSSSTLITPLATMSCLSLPTPTCGSSQSRAAQLSHSSSNNLILECAFCRIDSASRRSQTIVY